MGLVCTTIGSHQKSINSHNLQLKTSKTYDHDIEKNKTTSKLLFKSNRSSAAAKEKKINRIRILRDVCHALCHIGIHMNQKVITVTS